MTTLIDSEVASADAPPHRRRWWLWLLIGVVVLALIGTGTGWLVYAHTYEPLSFGNGPFGSVTPHTLKTIGDGLNDTNSILVGPAGTKGTVDYPIYNNGPRAVTLLGLDRTDGVPFDEAVDWAPVTNDAHGMVGQPRDGRPFPVTIRPGSEVILQATVSQPDCRGWNGGSESLADIPVRWSALGVHHVWHLALDGSGLTLPITVCPPKAAIARSTTDAL